MKILLVNPNSEFLINEKVFPSLGLLYLSAYLKNHGYSDISFLDMNNERPLPDFIEADIVGIYSNTPQFPKAMKVIHDIKKINRYKDAVYVFGGPHVSAKPDDAFGEADVVVIGEGEKAILDIVRRKESGMVQEKIIKRDYIKDIDDIPFPDRDIIDITSYKYYIDGLPATTVLSSRGCPFGCYFCANNAWGKTLRMRSPKNLFDEVSILKYKYGYEAIMFFDDTMTVSRKRMSGICELLKELKIIYRCFIRSDTVDADMLSRMKSSGCVEVGIGIESGSQRILNTINKGETVKKNMEAVKACRNAGIRVKGFFIIGLPGENKDSVRETMDFLDEADLDDLDITIYTPYPGSIIYNSPDLFDISFKNDYEHAWFKGKPGHYRSLVSTAGLTADEIVKLRDTIEKRYKKDVSSKYNIFAEELDKK